MQDDNIGAHTVEERLNVDLPHGREVIVDETGEAELSAGELGTKRRPLFARRGRCGADPRSGAALLH